MCVYLMYLSIIPNKIAVCQSMLLTYKWKCIHKYTFRREQTVRIVSKKYSLSLFHAKIFQQTQKNVQMTKRAESGTLSTQNGVL